MSFRDLRHIFGHRRWRWIITSIIIISTAGLCIQQTVRSLVETAVMGLIKAV